VCPHAERDIGTVILSVCLSVSRNGVCETCSNLGVKKWKAKLDVPPNFKVWLAPSDRPLPTPVLRVVLGVFHVPVL